MTLFDADWDPEWPATREEVDDWIASVTLEGLNDQDALGPRQGELLAELVEGGASLDEVIEIVLADVRAVWIEKGIPPFQLMVMSMGFRRGVEALAATLEIQALPESPSGQ